MVVEEGESVDCSEETVVQVSAAYRIDDGKRSFMGSEREKAEII